MAGVSTVCWSPVQLYRPEVSQSSQSTQVRAGHLYYRPATARLIAVIDNISVITVPTWTLDNGQAPSLLFQKFFLLFLQIEV